jgi:hypothetical protein
MSSFKRSQAKYVKKPYRVRNWPEYEAGLRSRGSLNVWISEDEIGNWQATSTGKRRRGGQRKYSNRAIETALTIGMVFHLPLRQTEGFLALLFALLRLTAPVPDHSTISRRSSKLGRSPLCEARGNKPVHILVDSSGLSIHVGTMRKPPKTRDWRKIHVAVDALTGEVLACDLTSKRARDASRVPSLLAEVVRPVSSFAADSAYDTSGVYKAIEYHCVGRSPRVLIPPKRNAQIRPRSPTVRERNRNIRSRRRLGTRAWYTKSGYSRRNRIETTFFRYKRIIGPAMRSRRLATQRVEARLGVKILNRMAALGMPDSYLAS